MKVEKAMNIEDNLLKSRDSFKRKRDIVPDNEFIRVLNLVIIKTALEMVNPNTSLTSREISEKIKQIYPSRNFPPDKVRKLFNHFGISAYNSRVGYIVKDILSKIERILSKYENLIGKN